MLRNIKPMNKFYRWQIQQGRYYQQQRKEKQMLLEDKIEGKKGRGKPRVTWTKKKKKIKEWLGHTYNGCVRRAKDRNNWRSMIADVSTTRCKLVISSREKQKQQQQIIVSNFNIYCLI